MIVNNRRKVKFYTHVVATTLQDRSSHCWIWCYSERSFPSLRTASFLGFFTSGCHSRGHSSNLVKVPIVSVSRRCLCTVIESMEMINDKL